MEMLSLGLSANDKYSEPSYIGDEPWGFDIVDSSFWGTFGETDRDLGADFCAFS